MRNLDLGQLRKEFLDYFEKQNHLVLKSFPLIPIDDDSLLLINAGMAPLKKYFTGEKKLSKDRVCSSQRCIRTPDIDEVGKTQRHATFFEMLGNFSFGDYFKEEAIQWAWDFLTNVIEIPVDRLWVSVYYEDTEAYNIWKDKIGVSPARIVKLGKEDNFWELEQGPCGPCSEIYVDRGYELDPRDDIKAGDDTERFVEVWNLVFTQFNKDEHGNYHRLKHPNIDTGMGLERLAMVVQNADNIFEIRLMKSIIEEIEKVSGKKYKTNEKDDISIRIISDHSRAMTFLVNDGVIPSNEGRGYVLRRLIRRAARHGKLLGIEDRFLERIVKQVIAIYKEGYPELKESEERILKIVRAEEEKFHETLALGLDILEEMIASTKDVFRGEDAFKLYDTYGFPLELTKEILDEKNITLDEDGFVSLMNEQKEKSRAGHKENMIGWTGKDMSYLKSLSKTSFDGYDCLEEEVEVIKIFFDNTEVSSLRSNEKGIIILDRTPFYAEGGGQVGDVGVLESDTASAKVETTTKTSSEAFLHHVEVIQGEISVGDRFTARVNEMTRRDTMKNHSATHLLDQALKDVLGNHIAQAGSYVDNHRLRFDITHFEAISKEDLRQVEAIVNEKIAMGLSVTATNMSLEESVKLGAIGLFEDKYKDVVRVVQMGNYSKELCGGTHVSTTSDIQMFKILSESSVAAGVRRIEAITGRAVYSYLLEKENFITDVMRELRVVHPEDVTKRILQQKEENKKLALDIQKLMREGSSNHVDEILKNGEDIDGIFVVTHKFEDMDSSLLRDMADQLKDRKKNSVVVLANVVKDKISFVASVSDEAIAQNIFAGNLVKFVAQMAGGNGGGKKNFAQAGGKDVSKVDNALKSVLKFVKEEKGGK